MTASPEPGVSALTTLDQAFLSIPDDETRQSVLALVRSIAAPAGHVEPVRLADGGGLAVLALSNPSSRVRK
jgi:hypothetical protein